MAGPLGARPHVLGAQPVRTAERRVRSRRRPSRSSTCSTCSRIRAVRGSTSATRVGYIGTDVYARFMRMNDRNVLHAMGYDSFGLPAEQFAVEHGQHPRATVDANVATMRRQLRALGLAHDPRRGIDTTDVRYYRWTQWIFLQIFNSWFDDDAGPRPADHRARRRARGRHARAARATPTPTSCSGSSSTTTCAAPWSTRTGSRISTRRWSTGARHWAPCSRTRRSRPTGAATAAITPCSGAR